MFFSLTAVEPKSMLLCRKQTLQRFIFLMDWKLKGFKMPFRDPAWGLDYVTRRLFLTSAENWDWKGRSEAPGLCLHEADKCLRSERCNPASGLLCLHSTKTPGWPDVFYQLWSLGTGTRKGHGQIIHCRGGNQGTERGRGGLAQGPTAKEGTEHSQILGTNNLRGIPQTNGHDPSLAF